MGSSVSTKLKLTSDGNLQISNDNDKLQIGTGQDLEIFFDGTHSKIDHTLANDYFTREDFEDLSGTTVEQALEDAKKAKDAEKNDDYFDEVRISHSNSSVINKFESLLHKLEGAKKRQKKQKSVEGRRDIFAGGLADMMSNF